jgi:gliding motility-associated-like protein
LISDLFAGAQGILPLLESNTAKELKYSIHNVIHSTAQREQKDINLLSKTSTDTCVKTFYKTYRSSSFCDMTSTLVESRDHNFIGCGLMRKVATDPGSQKGTIIKFDKTGNILMKKKMVKSSQIFDIIKLKDSMLLVPASQNKKLLLSKMDEQMKIIWTKSFNLGNHNFTYQGMIQAADSSLYILIAYDNPYPALLGLIKFSKNGDYIWQRNYASNNSFTGFLNSGLLELDGYLYFKTESGDGGYFPTDVIFKVNMTDGGIVWSKYYSTPGLRFAQASDFFAYKNHLVLYGGVQKQPPFYDTYPAIVFINKDGTVEKATIFKSEALSLYGFSTATTTSNGDLVLQFPANDYTVNPFLFRYSMLRLDSNLAMKHCYLVDNGGHLLETSDGFILNNGNNFYPDPYNTDLFLRKYTSDLQSGNCYSLPFSVTDSFINISPNPISFKYVADFTVTPVAERFLLEDYDLSLNQVLCTSLSNCSQVTLQGPQLVCNASDSVTYMATRNPGCAAPVSFVIDPAYGKIVYTDDSTVKIKYKASGNTTLYAEINAGCKTVWDSISISIHLSNDSLNLGPDVEVCGTIQYEADAGGNFKGYLWQDGSTEATFIISSPGLFYVTTKDFCNQTYSDSVRVSTRAPYPLSAGADTFKCNKDSIIITATAGFAKYSWNTRDHVIDTSSRIIKVSPTALTTYYITAEKSPGCISKDSITITVYNTPSIHLGEDTSICKGDSLLLDAGPGFSKWEWNTGGSARQLSIKQPDMYSVKAFDENGCFSTDTFSLIRVYPVPVIQLDKATFICQGTSKVLNAGSGFSSYLWSNGNVTSSLQISAIGKYWVTVTDSKGCQGSDTSEIKTIGSLPYGFMPKDTAICHYETISLQATLPFKDYLWSTGDIRNSITINASGSYWLQVTDNNGCKAKEFVKVLPKECSEGIFFPNAFTPNNDFINDTFKPLLFGNVTKFEFAVYNRFGQVVFKTNDHSKGWDGKLKGQLQPTGTYVWYCSYQLKDNPAKIEKGTVTLVK